MKRALNIIFAVLIAYLVICYVGQLYYGQMNANTKTVQEVVALANKTDDGQLIAKEFFKRYPTPTNSNLNVLIKLVDEITVRDIARQQTGDMTVKTKTEIELEKKLEAEKEMLDILYSKPFPFINISFLQSMVILLCLSMVVFALNFFSRRNN